MPDHLTPISDGQEPPEAMDIVVEAEGDQDAVHVDPATGAISVPLPDGSVEVDFSPEPEEKASKFNDNLTDHLGDAELGRIAEELLSAIEADDQSRQDWLSTRAKGIDLLGLTIEEPKGDTGTSSAPMEGMSTVRHPILLEACLMAQSNARGELLPSNGPVKVVNDGDGTEDNENLAEDLETDLNYYLTKKATEYYPDTDRMLLFTVFGGSGFKKVYKCPLRRRPVSESVDAKDLIVSNTATDLKNAGRVTHQISMRPSVLKRMQHVDAYRDVPLTQPTPQPNVVDRKEAQVQGVSIEVHRPEDQPYTIYECYCELDLDQFAPKSFKGEGIPLPFRVTIEKDSRQILELRRNWDEEDEDCQARVTFVQYPYIRGFGFYGIGLLHILGNAANALTAAWREMLDAGMFANFPGFLIAKLAARQQSNEMRVPPGAGLQIDTQGRPISDIVMKLPYGDVTPGLMQLTENIATATQRVGSVAEIKVGEGRQDAPVGTTIALLEQATKIESAVHKNLHQAQGEEFQLLADLFMDDPESFWRGNKRPSTQWDKAKLTKALNTYGLSPQADPNTPSHMQRVMKAVALKQLQTANPDLYDAKEVDRRILQVLHWQDIDSLFAPPAAQADPPPDPLMAGVMAKAAADMDNIKLKAAIKQEELADKAADRHSKEQIAVMKLAETMAIHPQAEGIVQNTLAKARPANERVI